MARAVQRQDTMMNEKTQTTDSETTTTHPRHAWATYEVLRAGLACVEVTYLGNDDLWSGLRVEVANPKIDANGVDPLYEAAYQAACVAVRPHGYTLARFSRVAS